MKSKYLVKICISLGFFLYFISWILKFFMTMDIPISFSTGEAFAVYILLMISAFMIVIGSFNIRSKQNRYRLIAIVGVILALNCSTFKIGWDSEYFTPAYAQLILSFILHNVLVIAGTIAFLIQRRRSLKSDGFDHA